MSRSSNPAEHLNPEEEAYNRALRFLSYRARSVEEVRRYLSRRGFDEVAESVIARLVGLGLLDDAAFAAGWIASRTQMKGFGLRRLHAELVKKGIDRALIEAKLAEVYDADADQERALDLAERRLPHLAGLDYATARRRLTQYLLNKGFDYDTVRSVVAQLLEEQ